MRWQLLLVAAACGRIGFDPLAGPGEAGTGEAGTDALPVLADGFLPCSSFGAWSAPQLVTELNTALNDWGATITADGLAIYFQRDLSGSSPTMWYARRADRASAFGAPIEIPELEVPMTGDPSITSDELEIFVDGNDGGVCVHRATRNSIAAAWDSPAPVPSACGTVKMICPWISADGLTLYVEDTSPNTIAVATRASRQDDFPTPQPYSGLFTGLGCPSVIGDGLELYIEQGAPQDIAVVTRASVTDEFDTAPATIAAIDTNSDETDASVTFDGLDLYFSSDRAGGAGAFDIYHSARACN